MPIRTIATLAVAIMLGLFAVVLVRNYVSKQTPAQQAQVTATVPVVVASREIKRGETLQPNLLKVATVPRDAAPAGSFQTIQQLTGTQGQERVALHTLIPNEPILPTKVTGPGGRAILSATVAEGMRAVSLRSNEVAGVSGFVLPGDHVDILLTRTNEGNTVTQTLANNVLVLGIDQNPSDESSAPQVARAVTVQVTPAQAHMITLAQSVGQVTLALRSISDQGLPMKKATTVAELGYFPKPRRPAPALPPAQLAAKASAPTPVGDQVRVTRGTEVTGYTLSAVR
jgi:pilus assembly protein CpaB